MWYLFVQVWGLLLISFVAGWLAHWFLCCRNSDDNKTVIKEVNSTSVADG